MKEFQCQVKIYLFKKYISYLYQDPKLCLGKFKVTFNTGVKSLNKGEHN